MTRVGNIIEVKWLDACQRNYEKEYIYGLVSGKELLITNITYGKLFKIGEDVVVIEHENSSDETTIDCTIIPRSWIISPKSLRDRRMPRKI